MRGARKGRNASRGPCSGRPAAGAEGKLAGLVVVQTDCAGFDLAFEFHEWLLDEFGKRFEARLPSI